MSLLDEIVVLILGFTIDSSEIEEEPTQVLAVADS